MCAHVQTWNRRQQDLGDAYRWWPGDHAVETRRYHAHAESSSPIADQKCRLAICLFFRFHSAAFVLFCPSLTQIMYLRTEWKWVKNGVNENGFIVCVLKFVKHVKLVLLVGWNARLVLLVRFSVWLALQPRSKSSCPADSVPVSQVTASHTGSHVAEVINNNLAWTVVSMKQEKFYLGTRRERGLVEVWLLMYNEGLQARICLL